MKRLARRPGALVKRERMASPPAGHAAHVFRVYPEPGRPFVVEVRIARDGRRMREEMKRLDGQHADLDPRVEGLVRTWTSKITGRPVVRPGGVIARMYLNVKALQRRPSELVSHECVHAAMGWARLQRADLSRMAGEEVMAYAAGRLVAQVNRVCFSMQVWP